MDLLNWLSGCANDGAGISPADLLREISGGQKPYVVDVREPDELRGPLGALPGVINVPLSQLA